MRCLLHSVLPLSSDKRALQNSSQSLSISKTALCKTIRCSSVARMTLATDRVLLVVLMCSNCRAPILDFVRAEKSSHVRSVDAGVRILSSIMIRKVRKVTHVLKRMISHAFVVGHYSIDGMH